MITSLVALFRDAEQAHQGLRVLKELQAEDSLALYGSAIMVKDAAGQFSLHDADGGPFGMTVGAVVGGALGLLAGPLGAAIGAAGGAAAGGMHETHEGQYRSQAVAQVASQVPPGGAAVVAEVAEFGQARLEERMRAVGGLVLREGRLEVEYQDALREVLALSADVDAAQADYEAALAKAAAERDTRLAEVRAQEAGTAQRLSLLTAFMQQQTDGRVALLQQQADQAGPETKAELGQQIAQIGGDHHARLARLQEVWAKTQAALGSQP